MCHEQGSGQAEKFCTLYVWSAVCTQRCSWLPFWPKLGVLASHVKEPVWFSYRSFSLFMNWVWTKLNNTFRHESWSTLFAWNSNTVYSSHCTVVLNQTWWSLTLVVLLWLVEQTLGTVLRLFIPASVHWYMDLLWTKQRVVWEWHLLTNESRAI